VTERKRPLERGVGLIRYSDEQEKEQPAAIAAGQVYAEDEHQYVDRQEHDAEIDPLHLVERRAQDQPRHDAVAEDDRAKQPRPRVATVWHERRVELDEQCENEETDQAQARNFDDVEVALAQMLLPLARLRIREGKDFGFQSTSAYRRSP